MANSAAGTDAPARRRWITLVRWLVAIAALAFIARYVATHIDELSRARLNLRVSYLLASVGAFLAYNVCRALAWHQITVRLGVGIHWLRAGTAWMYSLLGKYLPGKVFLLLGRLSFYVEEGRSKGQVTFAFMIEAVGSMLSSVYTILLALLLIDDDTFDEYRLPVLALVIGVTAALHPVLLERALNVGLRLLRRPPVRLAVSYRDMLLFVGVQTAAWVVFCLSFFLLVASLTPIGWDSFLFCAGAVSAATLLGTLVFLTPSGLGVREGALAFILALILPGPVSALISLVFRLWMTAGELLAVAATLILRKTSLLERLVGHDPSPTPSRGDDLRHPPSRSSPPHA